MIVNYVGNEWSKIIWEDNLKLVLKVFLNNFLLRVVLKYF